VDEGIEQVQSGRLAGWRPPYRSLGGDHCHAMTLAKRLKTMGSAKYQVDGDPRTSGPSFGVTIHPQALDEPRRWR
jgi:protein gp37